MAGNPQLSGTAADPRSFVARRIFGASETDPATPAQQLDEHLTAAIEQLTAPETKASTTMRGMQRLAHQAETVMSELDDAAGRVADRLSAAQARATAAIGKFADHAAAIEQTAAEVEAALAKLTNGPPPG